MFAWFNLGTALALYLQIPNRTLVVVSGVFDSYFWIGVFAFIGLGQIAGLLADNWRLLKIMLALGLFSQSMFSYALFVLGLHVGFRSVWGVFLLWSAVGWVKFNTLRLFPKGGKR